MLKEDIEKDLKRSLKKKENFKVQVLRFLLSSLHNQEIEKKAKLKEAKLTDEEIISVISSEIKKGKEAISEFEKGKREDLVKKEKVEIDILKKYLPEQLSAQIIKKLAEDIIKKEGYSEIKDMGKVMAKLMPKLRGRAEGKKVSETVKELLCRQGRASSTKSGSQGGFLMVYIVIIFLMTIILAVIIGPTLLTAIGEKTGIPCSPSYFSECRNSIDCWWQAECGVGKGIICFPQCSVEKYKVNCKNGKCIWEKG